VTSTLEVELGLRQKRRESVDHLKITNFHITHQNNKLRAFKRKVKHSLDRVRNAILYGLYPYNKTIWGAMRRPIWWGILFVRACPAFGINSLSFCVLLMLIDRRDQYQLVQFIMVFKKFQFWLNGVCGLLYYSAAYSYCVVIFHPKYTEVCGATGPGSTSLKGLDPNWIVMPIIVGFVLQIILVWIALYLLRFSLSKGENVRRGARLVGDMVHWEKAMRLKSMREVSDSNLYRNDLESSKFKIVEHIGRVVAFDRRTGMHTVDVTHDPLAPKDQKNNEKDEETGLYKMKLQLVPLHSLRYFVVSDRGPLRHLLYYDLGCFLFVAMLATLLLVVAFAQGTLTSGWQLRSVLLGAQIGYSLCALPFFFASLPPWKYVFTHARETGYNEVGVCVPTVKPFEYPWVAKTGGGGAGRKGRNVRRDRDIPVPQEVKDSFMAPPAPVKQNRRWSLASRAPTRTNFEVANSPTTTTTASQGPSPLAKPGPKYMPSLDVVPGSVAGSRRESLESSPEPPHRRTSAPKNNVGGVNNRTGTISTMSSVPSSPTAKSQSKSPGPRPFANKRAQRNKPVDLPGKPLGSELI
jgi:hypothetical protein